MCPTSTAEQLLGMDGIESPFIENGLGARISAVIDLCLLIVFPILGWIEIGNGPLWLKLVLSGASVGVGLNHVLKNPGVFFGGLLRFLGGKANIEMTPEGFGLNRRGFSTLYRWDAIRRIELAERVACYDDYDYRIVVHMKDGRDFWIESEPGWRTLSQMKAWAQGAIHEDQIVSGHYNAVGDFIEAGSET
jgi:hypothetical protein